MFVRLHLLLPLTISVKTVKIQLRFSFVLLIKKSMKPKELTIYIRFDSRNVLIVILMWPHDKISKNIVTLLQNIFYHI